MPIPLVSPDSGVINPYALKSTKYPITNVNQFRVIPKKRVKKRQETFCTYVAKLLKQVYDDKKISRRAMTIVNCFIHDIFDRLATESLKLMTLHGKKTLTYRDVETAVKLILPGELAYHAIAEARKAKQKYITSMNR